MSKLDEIEARLHDLPEGLRADWRYTNHFELHSNDDPFWCVLLEEAACLYCQRDADWTSDCGARLGLILDTVAAYKADVPDLLAVVKAAGDVLDAAIRVGEGKLPLLVVAKMLKLENALSRLKEEVEAGDGR